MKKITILLAEDHEISALSRNGKLGLVGMQDRARLLDGVLEIKSEPGKGTSVIVEAPI